MGKVYTVSGKTNIEYNHIEAGSVINISEMANVTINGSIGKNTRVNKRGEGDLVVKGQIGENVVFDVQGKGYVTFATKPPESVVNAIQTLGFCNIVMPDENASLNTEVKDISHSKTWPFTNSHTKIINGKTIHTQDGLIKITENGVVITYAGEKAQLIRGQLVIDNKVVIDSDLRRLHVEPDGRHLRTRANFFRPIIQPSDYVVNQNVEHYDLDTYSQDVQCYLAGFKNTIKYSDILRDLNLSEQDEMLLVDYLDPIHYEVIDIPVSLDGRLYNLDTLLEIQKGNKVNPFSCVEFALSDIQSAPAIAVALEKIVMQIKEAHDNAEKIQESKIAFK